MTNKTSTDLQPVFEIIGRIIASVAPQAGPLHGHARQRRSGLRGLKTLLPPACAKPPDPAGAIAAAEQRVRDADARTLEKQIQLAIVNDKNAALEAAAARAKEADADGAVAELIRRGVIDQSDWLAQADFKVKFITDPELIGLALGKRRVQPIRMT